MDALASSNGGSLCLGLGRSYGAWMSDSVGVAPRCLRNYYVSLVFEGPSAYLGAAVCLNASKSERCVVA